MTPAPSFDEQAAHRYFAVQCFNNAWSFIDLDERTLEETESMIQLTQASHWHWMQVKDHTETNVSIALWQKARVYALAGRSDEAVRYGRQCLEHATSSVLEPFYVAYGHEALARALAVAGDTSQARRHRDEASALAAALPDVSHREQLKADLNTIKL